VWKGEKSVEVTSIFFFACHLNFSTENEQQKHSTTLYSPAHVQVQTSARTRIQEHTLQSPQKMCVCVSE